MNINLSVRRVVKDDGRVVCFMHATQLAMLGTLIEEEVDEFGADGNDMRDASCYYCRTGRRIDLESMMAQILYIPDYKETV
jgi:hypothetical protein